MAFADLMGLEKQIAYFERVLERGTTAHAYALIGSQGLGKLSLAKALAAALLKVEVQGLATHPDVTFLSRPVDDKTGDKKRHIPLELIRMACDRLALSAVGGKKIVIIEDADTMTLQAQNALLKTLEEPAGSAVLVLLAEDRSRLLRTILSRCVPITLSCVPTKQLVQCLVARGYTTQVAEEAAKRAQGRPGVALRLADADALMEARKQSAILEAFIAAPRYVRIKTIATLVKGDDAKNADERQNWLLMLCGALYTRLHESNGQQAAMASGLAAVLDAREALRDNGHAALALERIALALP